MFEAKTDKGTASILIPANAWFDAAVTNSRELAGFEFNAQTVSLNDRMQEERRASLTVSVTMHPDSMQTLALQLLTAVGAPAFNVKEWALIAASLNLAATAQLDSPPLATQLRDMADTIRDSYSS